MAFYWRQSRAIVSGLVLVSAMAAAPAVATDELPQTVSYSRDIRPILSANCFKCHGPDERTREGDFRLDKSEAALADRGGYFGLVAGKPEESEAFRRIISDSDAELMPPPKSKKVLTPREIALVRRWIEQGAKYEQHWAFVRPARGSLPEVKNTAWPKNEIDRFVLRRLEDEGLAPASEADRHTLIRRASLDLIGLPPTPEEVSRFVNDREPEAYERLIDRLLDSPHYGERWAREWLDLARYSDTNGYEKDLPRSIWPWRDWVIEALNADMPFDRFTIEQLAGDLLPGATLAQRVATGFHRNTMLSEEGGVDPQEIRFQSIVDRVGVTGTTWLGLTVNCTQCHTHKYDSLTQREFYGMFAFLNNADEPQVAVPNDEVAKRRSEMEERIEQLWQELPEKFPLPDDACGATADAAGGTEAARRRANLDRKFAEWREAAARDAVRWRPLAPLSVRSNLATMRVQPDDSVLVGGDETKDDLYEVVLDIDKQTVTAFRLEVLPDDSLPARGPGRRFTGQGNSAGAGDFFLSELRAARMDDDADGKPQAIPVGLTDASHSYAAKDRSAAATLDGKSDTGWTIAGRPGEAHWAVFRLKEPLTGTGHTRLKIALEHESFYPAGIGRFRISLTDDARPIKASSVPDEVEQILLVPESERTAAQREQLFRAYLSVAPELEPARKEIAKLREKLPELPSTLVMQERASDAARVTHLHHRGEFLAPREVVAPGVPEVLHRLPSGAALNRLTFARWLVDPNNPLVGRVTMNRQWAALFGRGLVRTTEDFGVQGELPTHPALLDWLAVEFVERGWSLKKMHRLIATSATYRQSSRIGAELLARDPENRLLARAPRPRLDAELIRDSALRVSGLLSEKIGGPSVYPPQPASVMATAWGNVKWKASEGPDRYRRGLYTYNKRTSPFAMLVLFDGPTGEACVPRRTVSNTPLQALTLLNDEVFVEASQALARRVLTAGGSSAEIRIDFAFVDCLARPPEQTERQAIAGFLAQQRQRFSDAAADPLPVIGGEKAAIPEGTTPAELAAWTVVCRSLLNLDEFVTRP